MQFVLPPSLPETGRLGRQVDALRAALAPGCDDPATLARRLRARLPSAGVKVPARHTDALRREVAACVDVAALLIAIAKYADIEPEVVATRVLKTSVSRARAPVNKPKTTASASNSDIGDKANTTDGVPATFPSSSTTQTAPIKRSKSTTNAAKPTPTEKPAVNTANSSFTARSAGKRVARRNSKTSPGSATSAVTKSTSSEGSASEASKKGAVNSDKASASPKAEAEKSENAPLPSTAARQRAPANASAASRAGDRGNLNLEARSWGTRAVARKSRVLHVTRSARELSKSAPQPADADGAWKLGAKRVSAPSLPVARRLFEEEYAPRVSVGDMSPVTPAKDGELGELVDRLLELFGGRQPANRTMKAARMVRRHMKPAGYELTSAQDKRLVLATSSCTDLKAFLATLAAMVGASSVMVARDIVTAWEEGSAKKVGRLGALTTPIKLRKNPFGRGSAQAEKSDGEGKTEMKESVIEEMMPMKSGQSEAENLTRMKSVRREEAKLPEITPVSETKEEEPIVKEAEAPVTKEAGEEPVDGEGKPQRSEARENSTVVRKEVRNGRVLGESSSVENEFAEHVNDIKRLVLKAKEIGVRRARVAKSVRGLRALRVRVDNLEYRQNRAVSWPTVLCMSTVLVYVGLFQLVVLNQ